MTTVRTAAQRRQRQRRLHATAARRRFHDRGERAWQQYKRDGRARPAAKVFAQVDARIDARRRQLMAGRREITWSVGAELARRATLVTFPPAPEPQDWEPLRYELRLRPADLADLSGQAPNIQLAPRRRQP
jgi:hypothetical protein